MTPKLLAKYEVFIEIAATRARAALGASATNLIYHHGLMVTFGYYVCIRVRNNISR